MAVHKVILLLANALTIHRKRRKLRSDAAEQATNIPIGVKVRSNAAGVRSGADVVDDSSRTLADIVGESLEGRVAAEAELSYGVDGGTARNIGAASDDSFIIHFAGQTLKSSC